MAMLAVKVVPGASRSRVAGRYGDGIKVQVSAAPEKGKANAAVIEVLAEALGVRECQVVLVSGQTQPRKVFRIDGVDDAEFQRRLEAVAGG
ncbi:MAG: DUF167 domain-containing protein [Tepidisphaeraceae bacterium]|jgi:hypothetical protein